MKGRIQERIKGVASARDRIESCRREFFEEHGGKAQPTYDERGRPISYGGLDTAIAAARLAQECGDPIPDWVVCAVESSRPIYRDVVKLMESSFRSRGNFMDVVEAYLLGRIIGDPVPDWVLLSLDAGMAGFRRRFQQFAVGEAPNRPGEAFAEAFRIHEGRKSGRGTLWSELLYDFRPIEIGRGMLAAALKRVESARAFNEGTLIQKALDEFERLRSERWPHVPPMSISTARRAWATYKRTHPENAAKVQELIAGAGARRPSHSKKSRTS